MSGDLDETVEGRETLGQTLDTLSTSVDRRFDAVEKRFATLSAFLDERFDAVDVALVEQRKYTEFAFDRLASRFDVVDSRFDRLERKLDQFIDTQSTTNKLVERRLRATARRSAKE